MHSEALRIASVSDSTYQNAIARNAAAVVDYTPRTFRDPRPVNHLTCSGM